MIRAFNFFRGMVGARVVSIGGALNELNEPYIPLQITHAPPMGMSYRHWNMLPQDLRGGDPIRAEIYVAGWEACLSGNLHINPYVNFNDPIMIENREAWNRGYMTCMNRRTRTYTERDMEYYHTEDFLFFDVSEVRYNMVDGFPYKVMLYRSIEEGNTVEGQTIYPDHYMYYFPDVI
jgi:hypothetical protein